MTDFETITDFDIGFIMGLVVGEGSFTGDKRTCWLCIKMHENDPNPLLKVYRLLGGRVYGPYVSGGRHFHNYFLRGLALARSIPLFKAYLPPSRKREQFEQWLVKYDDYLTSRIALRPMRAKRKGARVIGDT